MQQATVADPVATFKKLGDDASYHYADDSTREWRKATRLVHEALEVFDAHPELQPKMRKVARGFLWHYEFQRQRPES